MASYISKRLKEFEILGRKGEIFFDFRPFADLTLKSTLKSELAFCISTANSSALSGLRFQKMLGDGLDIQTALKKAGVRFYKRKSGYVEEAFSNFERIIKALDFDSTSARKRLLKVRGLGMKEASHFLRNTGREDVAIVDRHVLKWLKVEEYISEVPSITEKKYVEVEGILSDIAEERKCSLAELDLRIWAQMTGKVLK